MIWREKRVLLAVLGVLLALNTAFFFTYRVQYQRRLASLEEKRELSESQLAVARAARSAADRRVAMLGQIQRDIQDIYNRAWSTEPSRLTPLISEVKHLATASELVPRSISFSRNSQAKSDTEEVTISFTVQGNYQQVRRLINLLELSGQFVIIDQISLSSSDGQLLTLTLQLKTLFRDTAGRESR